MMAARLLLAVAVLAGLVAVSPAAAADRAGPARPAAAPQPPDSMQMQKDLQRLTWKQFRAVIEAVPKLREDVEAYGEAGWKYVQARYATYPWKKKIDKLDPDQRRQLADLIRRAKRQPG